MAENYKLVITDAEGVPLLEAPDGSEIIATQPASPASFEEQAKLLHEHVRVAQKADSVDRKYPGISPSLVVGLEVGAATALMSQPYAWLGAVGLSSALFAGTTVRHVRELTKSEKSQKALNEQYELRRVAFGKQETEVILRWRIEDSSDHDIPEVHQRLRNMVELADKTAVNKLAVPHWVYRELTDRDIKPGTWQAFLDKHEGGPAQYPTSEGEQPYHFASLTYWRKILEERVQRQKKEIVKIPEVDMLVEQLSGIDDEHSVATTYKTYRSKREIQTATTKRAAKDFVERDLDETFYRFNAALRPDSYVALPPKKADKKASAATQHNEPKKPDAPNAIKHERNEEPALPPVQRTIAETVPGVLSKDGKTISWTDRGYVRRVDALVAFGVADKKALDELLKAPKQDPIRAQKVLSVLIYQHMFRREQKKPDVTVDCEVIVEKPAEETEKHTNKEIRPRPAIEPYSPETSLRARRKRQLAVAALIGATAFVTVKGYLWAQDNWKEGNGEGTGDVKRVEWTLKSDTMPTDGYWVNETMDTLYDGGTMQQTLPTEMRNPATMPVAPDKHDKEWIKVENYEDRQTSSGPKHGDHRLLQIPNKLYTAPIAATYKDKAVKMTRFSDGTFGVAFPNDVNIVKAGELEYWLGPNSDAVPRTSEKMYYAQKSYESHGGSTPQDLWEMKIPDLKHYGGKGRAPKLRDYINKEFTYELDPPTEENIANFTSWMSVTSDALINKEADCNLTSILVAVDTDMGIANGYRNFEGGGSGVLSNVERHAWNIDAKGGWIDATPTKGAEKFAEHFDDSGVVKRLNATPKSTTEVFPKQWPLLAFTGATALAIGWDRRRQIKAEYKRMSAKARNLESKVSANLLNRASRNTLAEANAVLDYTAFARKPDSATAALHQAAKHAKSDNKALIDRLVTRPYLHATQTANQIPSINWSASYWGERQPVRSYWRERHMAMALQRTKIIAGLARRAARLKPTK